MKKLAGVVIGCLMVLGLAGQSKAAFFGDLELIRYINAGTLSTTEKASDIGKLNAAGGATVSLLGTFTASAINVADFAGASGYGDLGVTYFVKNQGTQDLYVSGTYNGTQSSAGSKWTTASGNTTNVESYYASLGGANVTATTAYANSAFKKLEASGNSAGSLGGFLVSGGWNARANLAGLATIGYVDQTLFFYDTPNVAAAGYALANIRTYADGRVAISAISNVPIPPSVFLFASGLIGMIGIKRKTSLFA